MDLGISINVSGKQLSANWKITLLAFIIILLKDFQSLRSFISNSEVRYIVISKTSTTLLLSLGLNISSGRNKDL